MDQRAAIAAARPEIPNCLNDRAGDIWEPLLALADLAGGTWPEVARQAAVGLSANSEEASPIGALLADILLVFLTAQANRLFTRTLLAGLNCLEDRPWAELRKGRQVTDLWLARQLRSYGIQPKTVWIGETSAKGYLEEDFAEVFRRYIPAAEIESLVKGLKGPTPTSGQPNDSGQGESGAELTPCQA